MFFEDVQYSKVFKSPIITTNNTKDLSHLNIFSYFKYFSVILSFFLFFRKKQIFII